MDDPLVKAVRDMREEIAARFRYSVQTIVENAQRHPVKSKRKKMNSGRHRPVKSETTRS